MKTVMREVRVAEVSAAQPRSRPLDGEYPAEPDGRVFLILVLGLALNACGAAAVKAGNLQPGQIPRGHGAAIGRVQVFKGDSEVTGSCYVGLTDRANEPKGNISLDRTGWVMVSPVIGPTYLSSVSCIVWNGLNYGTRLLSFNVVGDGKTTYFGHVQFHLANRDWQIALDAVTSSVATVPVTGVVGAVASNLVTGATEIARFDSADGENHVTVQNDLDTAIREYSARYHRAPDARWSVVGAPSLDEARPTPPVTFGPEFLSSRVQLDAFQVTWLGVARSDRHWLGFSLLHPLAPGVAPCPDVEVSVNGELHHFPLTYRTQTSSALRESVPVEVDIQTFEALAQSHNVDVEVCGKTSHLPPRALAAAGSLVDAYETLMARLPRAPKEIEPTNFGARQGGEQGSPVKPDAP